MTAHLTFDGYRPGALAATIALHMAYYAPTWGFGAAFESALAREMGDFMARLDPARDLFLTAYDRENHLVGTITVDGENATDDGARVRWFVVSEAARGHGLGKRLMAEAIHFLHARDYPRAYLTTFEGLDTARTLYERNGFRLVEGGAATAWSGDVRSQRFEWSGRPRP
ncbi:GNAT family N-acetyltransferase [Amorphus sp. 3PC139-8]|uniref:GNAT family N-acetyltransferase n=1 Tax=Amorphus sp. 3PC139-8 TaxID=2735676 RepID=UPI00345CD649